MKKWFLKRKLAALAEKLAIYNDKGIYWQQHDVKQAALQREELAVEIKEVIEELGPEKISGELLLGLENGELKTDSTGKFIYHAKQTKL